MGRHRLVVEHSPRESLGLGPVLASCPERKHLGGRRDGRIASGRHRDLGQSARRDVERYADRNPPLGPVQLPCSGSAWVEHANGATSPLNRRIALVSTSVRSTGSRVIAASAALGSGPKSSPATFTR